MQFKDSSEFRAKISALAKQAKELKFTLDKIDEGRFLISDGKRSYHVVLAFYEKSNEIGVACECETYRNSGLCVHIAYALKQCCNAKTDNFDIPKVGEIVEKIVMSANKKEEKSEEKTIEKTIIVDYTPKKVGNFGKNISELLNQTFVIKAVEFTEVGFGKIAIFTLENGERYYTGSKVLLRQAEEIEKLCDEGKLVRVTLKKVKRYYTF